MEILTERLDLLNFDTVMIFLEPLENLIDLAGMERPFMSLKIGEQQKEAGVEVTVTVDNEDLDQEN